VGSVTAEADVQHAVQATLATFGRIDVLVNNAGNLSHVGPLHETTDEVWDGVLDVSRWTTGAILTVDGGIMAQ
jgi:NAD(P)-dependent dehydrogenase (short-subunit alcohol dehydrogenase family)